MRSTLIPPDERPFSLIGMLRRNLRLRHYSERTEGAYVSWVRRFVRFHQGRHPRVLGPSHLRAFLGDLATRRGVSASTQNQAVAALLFLYRDVIREPLPWLAGIERAKRPRRLPVVLTRGEVAKVLDAMAGASKLVGILMYGGGLRVSEAVSLRVKDVDFATRSVTVRAGKGGKDRETVLPDRLVEPLQAQLARAERLWREDVRATSFGVMVPGAFADKVPSAPRMFEWYWLFPAARRYVDAKTGLQRRHHLHQTVVQRSVTNAAKASGIMRRVTCHTFRHSFATHLLDAGTDIRTIQELMGHTDVSSTMLYTHVLGRGARGVRSPADV